MFFVFFVVVVAVALLIVLIAGCCCCSCCGGSGFLVVVFLGVFVCVWCLFVFPSYIVRLLYVVRVFCWVCLFFGFHVCGSDYTFAGCPSHLAG